jgi:sarcosine oxidase gamma subunit
LTRLPALTLTAATPRARLGLKGREAATLLQGAGVAVPARANAILRAASSGAGSRCLRLGATEFIIEDDGDGERIASLAQQASAGALRAFVAPRSDFSAVLAGPAVFDSLSPFCAYDFAALQAQPDAVVMTLLADISVVLALEPGEDSAPRLRLWADPGYGQYLTETLTGEHR